MGLALLRCMKTTKNAKLVKLLERSLEALGDSSDLCLDQSCDCEGNEKYKDLAGDMLDTIAILKGQS